MSELTIQQDIKLVLPGETPWGRVVAIHDDGTMQAMIDNDLVCTEKHGFICGDVATFKRVEDESGEFGWWALADEQRPTLKLVETPQ